MKRNRSLFAGGLLFALLPAVPAAAAETGQIRQMTAVTIVPAQPKPDQPFRLHVEGTGTCKLWVRTKLLDPLPAGGPSTSPGAFSGLADLAAPPTATVNLPGDLPAMSLSTGHWAIDVSAREVLNAQNCKGEEIVDVRVGNPPTIPIPVAPGGGGKVTGAAAVSSGSTAGLAGGGSPSTSAVSGAGGAGPNASSAATQLTHRMTAVTIIPAAPKPDQPFRLRADGTGNCKLWVRTKLLDPSPAGGPSFGSGYSISFAGLWDLAAPPTATVNLPADLPAMSLSTGHWAIGVSAREGYGGNCKGEEIVDVRVGTPPTVPIPIAPGGGGKVTGAAAVSGGSTAALAGGGSSSSAAGMSGAGSPGPNASSVSTQFTRRMTSAKLIPAQPKPDQPFRIHVEGTGNCRLWVRTKLFDPSPAGGPSFGAGGVISFAGLWDLAAPPTATLNLPGDLPPMSLSTGHWAIAVSAREILSAANCKGEEVVEVRIGGSGISVSGQPAGGTNLPLTIATPVKK